MLYFSNLLKSQIIDNTGKCIGLLSDLIIPIDKDYPSIKAIVVTYRKKNKVIPLREVESFGKGVITLGKSEAKIREYFPKNDEIKLKEAVFDKQLLDSEGLKIVRANDIVISKIQEEMSIVGIDISFVAILRRLGLSFLTPKEMNSQFVAWKELTLIDSPKHEVQLKNKKSSFNEMHPADIANLVEDLNSKRGAEFVARLDLERAADVLEELDEEHRIALVRHLAIEKASDILENMPPDQVADVLDNLPKYKAKELMDEINPEESEKILKLVSYNDEEAGGLMTTDYFTVEKGMTIQEAKEKLKKTKEEIPTVSYVYVVDKKGILQGVLSLRQLITLTDSEKIEKVMVKNLITVNSKDKVNKIARNMTKYNLFSVAVTDQNNKLLGIVMIDDLMRKLFPEA